MANPNNKNPNNINAASNPSWFCDMTCSRVSCSRCLDIAPNNFASDGSKSWVGKQPVNQDETLRVTEAKAQCPFKAIGDNGVLPPPPPDAPTNLVAAAGVGSVALTWTGVSGAIAYFIKRGAASGEELTVGDANTTSYSETIEAGTYYYVVSAVGAGGESANSNEVEATPTIE